MIKVGRRRAALFVHIIAISSSSIAMIGSVFSITVARFLLGVAGGFANIIFGKSVNENFPEKLASKLGLLNNTMVCFGVGFAYGLGSILPDPKDVDANKEDENWRFIYSVPGMVGIISIILLLTVFRYEPVSFCINVGLEKEG